MNRFPIERPAPVDGVQWHIGRADVLLEEYGWPRLPMWLAKVYEGFGPREEQYIVHVWRFLNAASWDNVVKLGPYDTLDEALDAADNAVRLDVGGWKEHRLPMLIKDLQRRESIERRFAK